MCALCAWLSDHRGCVARGVADRQQASVYRASMVSPARALTAFAHLPPGLPHTVAPPGRSTQPPHPVQSAPPPCHVRRVRARPITPDSAARRPSTSSSPRRTWHGRRSSAAPAAPSAPPPVPPCCKLGFRVQGSGLRVQGQGVKVLGS